MLKTLEYCLILFCSICLYSCANQTAPQGGPKDEEPPVLQKSIPAQGEVNFEGQKIELEFDEYIQTNQPKQEIIITPTIQQEYDIKVRKNTVTLSFEEPLEDSTTYTINFRESIQDITEKNSPEDLKLAFSTGAFLDSMTISGSVLNLLTQQPVSNLTVGLYRQSDTLSFLEHVPNYFTKTTEEGTYQIDNIKVGQYRLFAFQDQNKNLTPQTKSESYGYDTSLIVLDSAYQSNLLITALNLDTLTLSRSRQIATTYNIKYNKYVNEYSIVTFDSTEQIISNFTDDTHETIQIFNTFPIADSIPIFTSAVDSLQNTRIDTLFLKFKETTRKPLEFKHTASINKITTNAKILNATVNFTKPITAISFDSAYIYIDSLHIYPIDSSHLTWNHYQDKFDLTYTLPDSIFQTFNQDSPSNQQANQTPPKPLDEEQESVADSTYTPPPADDVPHLYFGTATFISPEKDTANVIKQPISFNTPESLGIIEFNVVTEEPCYFIHLLDDKYNIIKELYNPTETVLENLNPLTYKIRIIIDSNCNQQWDFGNLLNNVPPEDVIIYTSPDNVQDIILRANWVNTVGDIKF